MKRNPTLLLTAILAALPCLSQIAKAADPAPAPPAYFDVRSYGAKGDGKTLDTQAINDAIDAAAAAGGGTVYFRAGTYPSYTIHMKSNIALYLDHGATLLAAGPTGGGIGGPGGARGRGRGAPRGGAGGPPPPAAPPAPGAFVPSDSQLPFLAAPATPPAPAAGAPAYDAPEPNEWDPYEDFGHSHFHNSLIVGENIHDISILGPGMIDGNGLARNAVATSPVGVGNKVLSLKLCRNINLHDFTFFRGGHFCILATGCDNFTIDNIKVDTNRDGFDIDSCKNVHVSNCTVNSPQDDGICLKADYALGYSRVCENVTISNCQVSGYVMGSLLDGTYNRSSAGGTGRIKFGTESNGGFKNIAISNCVFDHCRGFAIESVDGGIVEDVSVTNLTMRDIFNSPIFIRLGNRARGPKDKTPVAQVRRILINNVSASGCDPRYPVLISGIPGHPIEDVQLSHIRIAYLGGGTAEQAAPEPPEKEDQYPEPNMFGVLNASAFFIRHVTNLEMDHIDITFDKPDLRPAFVLTDVNGADFQHMKIQRFDNVPMFKLNKITDFSTENVRSVVDMKRDSIDSDTISK